MKICIPEFGTELSEIEDEELFPVNSHNSGSFALSPDAIPFHPLSSEGQPLHSNYDHREPIEIAIYCNGVPCLTLPTEADRSTILHGINDEAILDEGCFPLDAIDAAELEATDAFVIEMANLALLEEREEQARQSFNHIQKRWESRRKAGLTGRPHPCMHLHEANDHLVSKSMPSTSPNSLVPVTSINHRNNHIDDKMRVKVMLYSHKVTNVPRRSTNNKIRRPIQQPRKETKLK